MKIKLDPGAFAPERAHPKDAGLDIRTPESVYVPPNGAAIIRTGVHVELPPNTAGILKSKSGLNVHHGITSTGTIDEGYTGEIKVKLYNHSSQGYQMNRGNKITQLLVVPVQYVTVEIVDEINGGERGDNGFGSTGR